MIAGARAVLGWLFRTWPGRLTLAAIVGATAAWYLLPRGPVPAATTSSTATSSSASAGTAKRTAASTAQADLETIGGETVIDFNDAGFPVRIRHHGGTLRMNLKASTTTTADLAWSRTANSTVSSSSSTPLTTQGTAGRWGLGAAVLIPVRGDEGVGLGLEVRRGLGQLDLPLLGDVPFTAAAGVDFPIDGWTPRRIRIGVGSP